MTHVLYIGGTGEISRACVEEAVRLGHQVSVFNRGSTAISLPATVECIRGDLGGTAPYAALAGRHFDVVCQFLAFDTDAIERDLAVFAELCDQYVFVSSAAAYSKPLASYRVTEDAPLGNTYWDYGTKKAECERAALAAQANSNMAVTIVRPSHTYRTRLPGTVIHGDHQAWRILRGKPIIAHGDGQSLWTLTHADDFARAFVQLCANPKAYGEAFHITTSEAHTWDNILTATGTVLGATPDIRHIASDALIRYEPNWRGPLLGDKANSIVFDNAKVRDAIGPWTCEITLAQGLTSASAHVLERLADGYAPDPHLDALIDRIIDDQNQHL